MHMLFFWGFLQKKLKIQLGLNNFYHLIYKYALLVEPWAQNIANGQGPQGSGIYQYIYILYIFYLMSKTDTYHDRT